MASNIKSSVNANEDIQLITNSDYFVDVSLNRPVRNMHVNQEELFSYLHGILPFLGSQNGVFQDTGDYFTSEKFFASDNNIVSVTISKGGQPDKNLTYFRFPYGIAAKNGALIENIPSAQKIEQQLSPFFGLLDQDRERFEIRYTSSGYIKARLSKIIDDNLLNGIETVYFINSTKSGPNFSAEWENDTDGYYNVITMLEDINNFVYNDINFTGVLYDFDFSSLSGERIFEINTALNYSIKYDADHFAVTEIAMVPPTEGADELLFGYLEAGVYNDLRYFISTSMDESQGFINISNNTSSIGAETGAVVVAGGVGIGENLNVLEDATVGGTLYLPSTTTNNIVIGGEVSFARTITNTVTITGDIIVDGNFTVTGNTSNSNELTVTSATITVNDGTTGVFTEAGIIVDTGGPLDYNIFYVNDGTNRLVIGLDGLEQTVATREATPVSNGIAYWDSTAKMFVTDADLTHNGTTTTIGSSTSNTLAINSKISTNLVFSDSDKSIDMASASARTLSVTNTGAGSANLVVAKGKIGVGIASPEANSVVHTKGAVRVDDTSGNAGFRMEYDNTTKSLRFIYVGV